MSMAKTIGEAVAFSEDADVHDILHRVLSEFYGEPCTSDDVYGPRY